MKTGILLAIECFNILNPKWYTYFMENSNSKLITAIHTIYFKYFASQLLRWYLVAIQMETYKIQLTQQILSNKDINMP